MRAAITAALSPSVECVELLDLTPAPEAMTKAWRQQTTELAVRRAIELQASGQHLLLAGDPAVLPHHQNFAQWMRKHAADPLRMTHVVSDGGWVEMRWERLEVLAADWQMHTIDTTQMTKQDVAHAALDWCHHALTGDASALGLQPSETRKERGA